MVALMYGSNTVLIVLIQPTLLFAILTIAITQTMAHEDVDKMNSLAKSYIYHEDGVERIQLQLHLMP